MGKNNDHEPVQYSFNSNFENYIKKIYYELETERAVMFGRNKDDKVLFIPKSSIKGGWKRDKKLPQNIKVTFGIKLFWQPRKF
ncbi:MAG: hypothetical protein V3V33_01740 [Candidatus Lokiarchaeia archaeon]